ncbi:hypothetical protein [Vibrio zhugei]|uniref:hypothetical protein n=1 Tax=Vibrio zhugei TaxID=2479546 RepID=UPI000F0BA014|nr:hypothetical protein [Vibrio zhugei]
MLANKKNPNENLDYQSHDRKHGWVKTLTVQHAQLELEIKKLKETIQSKSYAKQYIIVRIKRLYRALKKFIWNWKTHFYFQLLMICL